MMASYSVITACAVAITVGLVVLRGREELARWMCLRGLSSAATITVGTVALLRRQNVASLAMKGCRIRLVVVAAEGILAGVALVACVVADLRPGWNSLHLAVCLKVDVAVLVASVVVGAAEMLRQG